MGSIQASSLTNHPRQGSPSKTFVHGFELSLQSSSVAQCLRGSDERLSKKPTKSIYLTKKDPNVSSPTVLNWACQVEWYKGYHLIATKVVSANIKIFDSG
jgi:hypothetical protein